ncbi:hypothetical protein GGR55DRAFT_139841 [Xylaria sp. FL0064]|nr:hypothetical protein GGR55DRAFT_139841 [Xylaria sp. FL0064]
MLQIAFRSRLKGLEVVVTLLLNATIYIYDIRLCDASQLKFPKGITLIVSLSLFLFDMLFQVPLVLTYPVSK